jgi:hypothetical protein
VSKAVKVSATVASAVVVFEFINLVTPLTESNKAWLEPASLFLHQVKSG